MQSHYFLYYVCHMAKQTITKKHIWLQTRQASETSTHSHNRCTSMFKNQDAFVAFFSIILLHLSEVSGCDSWTIMGVHARIYWWKVLESSGWSSVCLQSVSLGGRIKQWGFVGEEVPRQCSLVCECWWRTDDFSCEDGNTSVEPVAASTCCWHLQKDNVRSAEKKSSRNLRCKHNFDTHSLFSHTLLSFFLMLLFTLKNRGGGSQKWIWDIIIAVKRGKLANHLANSTPQGLLAKLSTDTFSQHVHSFSHVIPSLQASADELSHIQMILETKLFYQAYSPQMSFPP